MSRGFCPVSMTMWVNWGASLAACTSSATLKATPLPRLHHVVAFLVSSPSRRSVGADCCRKAARWKAVVVFPTPTLWIETVMITAEFLAKRMSVESYVGSYLQTDVRLSVLLCVCTQ